ncbi:hypothetical protein LX32DRAFT_638040 [Colletotrichum zoysiae]|uniref:Uncharacterized protein n=1 Tax=Colletotrichum zoysiae TaxID=1216348 RepID=A0AAD9M6F4_9PEZI|nr:hypothetical protein LX32DRAFT_638040 [Colletotrichum zoysiae]
MKFLTITLALVAMPFVAAEPIPVDVAGRSEQPVVRNVLIFPREPLPPCCSNGFAGNCDCGNCPILQCAVSLKSVLFSHPPDPSQIRFNPMHLETVADITS